MSNAELIKAIRDNEECNDCAIAIHDDCNERRMSFAAAYALEAADKRIAGLEAQLPKEGKWIRKEVKVYCPRDCWNPSACAIEGTWNEEEGWNLEMQDGFCSVCGEQDEKYYKHNYCPNCGARMKGEQE